MPARKAKTPSGMVVVISGPSGAGKTTVCKHLVERHGYALSVSATTRKPRPGEKHGVEYYFYTRERFLEGVKKGEFLEHSEHFDNLYGTPRAPVEESVAKGRVILLEIDINGARQVMERMPGAHSIFLTAPDMGCMESRLRGRLTESEAAIRTRLQRADMEMAAQMKYNDRVVNDNLEQTVARVHQLIQAEVRKRDGC